MYIFNQHGPPDDFQSKVYLCFGYENLIFRLNPPCLIFSTKFSLSVNRTISPISLSLSA